MFVCLDLMFARHEELYGRSATSLYSGFPLKGCRSTQKKYWNTPDVARPVPLRSETKDIDHIISEGANIRFLRRVFPSSKLPIITHFCLLQILDLKKCTHIKASTLIILFECSFPSRTK